ncbi:hypothetical protein M3J09_010871 [Ascochyta lentis]
MPSNNAATPASTAASHTEHATANGVKDNGSNNASESENRGPRLAEYQGPTTTTASLEQWNGTSGNSSASASRT